MCPSSFPPSAQLNVRARQIATTCLPKTVTPGGEAGRESGLAGSTRPRNGTDVDEIRRRGVENAQPPPIVVAQGSIGLLCRGSRASERSRSGRVWIHNRVPHRRVAEAQSMAKFVDEQRFKITGARAARQRRWRGERHLWARYAPAHRGIRVSVAGDRRSKILRGRQVPQTRWARTRSPARRW